MDGSAGVHGKAIQQDAAKKQESTELIERGKRAKGAGETNDNDDDDADVGKKSTLLLFAAQLSIHGIGRRR